MSELQAVPATAAGAAVAPVLTPRVTFAMAVAAGSGAADVWYNQPMVGLIARDFGAGSTALVTLMPTATQLGFAAGILLLLPLGDRMDRRALILRQLIWLTLALLAAAAAPGPVALLTASVAIGMGGCIAQQIIPFAAELAPPQARGRVVGTVMSGLLMGILLGRVLSGAVAQQFGWRAMFALAAVIAVLVGVMLAAILPRSRPLVQSSYGGLLASLVALVRAYPRLRRATLTQAGLFGAFTAFWSVLALQLQAPPLILGSEIAGLFGLAGAAGVAIASLAGRMSDRHGPRRVIGAGIALAGAGYVVLACWPTLSGLVVGCVLLDLGMQGAQIANQTVIYGLQPDARGRLNTVFMTGMFTGGAIGSAAAGIGWTLGGWPAVCGVGLASVLGALAAHLAAGRAKLPTPGG